MADDLSRLHTTKPVYAINNGFDPKEAIFSPPKLTEKFTITYTGVLYNGKRDPLMLFEEESNKEGHYRTDRIEVRFLALKILGY